MSHRFPTRVYYEDTDAAGLVYYANYLKFMERARTEWLRELGYQQAALAQEQGIAFVARRCTIDYLKPVRLDDLLIVVSDIEWVSRAQIVFAQRIECHDMTRTTASIQIVCVDPAQGRVTAMPHPIYERFKALMNPATTSC